MSVAARCTEIPTARDPQARPVRDLGEGRPFILPGQPADERCIYVLLRHPRLADTGRPWAVVIADQGSSELGKMIPLGWDTPIVPVTLVGLATYVRVE